MPEQFKQFDFSREEDREKFGKLDKGKQKEVAQEAEEEAYLMNNEAKELEKTVERELSPEAIEKIMEKVQDVNKEGTAFHNIHTRIEPKDGIENSYDKFSEILKDGLLGTTAKGYNYNRGEEDCREIEKVNKELKSQKEKFALLARRYKSAIVFFNIIGRSIDEDKQINISQSFFTSKDRPGIIFIFDISKFKEIKNTFSSDARVEQQRGRTFFAGGYVFDSPKTKEGFDKYNEDNEGFYLFHRVLPRYFKGVVLSGNENIYRIFVKKMTETYKNKSELLIPIYDISGNLIWPKQMSYEKVKKFVAERDKKKEKVDSETTATAGQASSA